MHFSFVASSCDYSSAIICGCTHSSQRSRPGNEFLAEWDNQRTVCAPLLSAERREASQSVPEKKNITGDLSQTGCTEHRSTKGICLKTCTQHCRSCLGVFVKGKKTVKIKAVFLWSVQEKSYLLVKRWAKAGVAVESSLITARLRDVLLKCWGHSWATPEARRTSDKVTFIQQQQFLHLAPTLLNSLVSSSCVFWGKFRTAE